MKVNTVLGPVDTRELGVTLMHEHIANIDWSFVHAFPDSYDKARVVAMFCEEMQELKAYGVRTFVDATPINLGRDVDLMRQCAERSGIHIIAGTGLYWQEGPFLHMEVDAEVLAERMLSEIEHGMEGTDSKPGFIKCATQLQPGETECNKNMLRAAAMVSKATGLPIYTHMNPGSQLGRYQKQIFHEEGVAPEKIAFGHAFSVGAEAFICELVKDGSFAGCDQLAFKNLAVTEQLADLLAALCKRDLHRHIFLSCDAAVWSDFGIMLTRNVRNRETNHMVRLNRRKQLFERFLPMLRERGVEEAAITEILVGNPRRFFGGEG